MTPKRLEQLRHHAERHSNFTPAQIAELFEKIDEQERAIFLLESTIGLQELQLDSLKGAKRTEEITRELFPPKETP